MPAGLRDGVDIVCLREPSAHLRLVWTASDAAIVVPSGTPALRRRARELVTPEELFVALDGRTVAAESGRLSVEVFSISDEAGARWLQLALAGSASKRMLTVRLKAGDSAHDVLSKLEAWLADPAGASDVFNVA